jgi:hypothetical protein
MAVSSVVKGGVATKPEISPMNAGRFTVPRARRSGDRQQCRCAALGYSCGQLNGDLPCGVGKAYRIVMEFAAQEGASCVRSTSADSYPGDEHLRAHEASSRSWWKHLQ